jgi:hypothetical protein
MTTRNDHPYKAQPAKAFWPRAVASRHYLEVDAWYTKKWPIADARVATAGSCFAQHIGRYLRNSGYHFVDVERPPAGLGKSHWLDFGYDMYSARYGNVYSPRQLLQLLQRALGEFRPEEPAWAHEDGFVDPFRPTIEPKPFRSAEEMTSCRATHLHAVSKIFEQADLFVFTLGLTEAWQSSIDGAVFPVCPGTQGGQFDSARHRFVNFGFQEVVDDMQAFFARVRSINPAMRFLLTVSPVPLMATATQDNVIVATSYSKAVLRAAAGHLAQVHEFVDYFPSYEIISSHPGRGMFYEPDLRSVVNAGVAHVMAQFFKEHVPPGRKARPRAKAAAPADDAEDVVCDELILASFGEGKN